MFPQVLARLVFLQHLFAAEAGPVLFFVLVLCTRVASSSMPSAKSSPVLFSTDSSLSSFNFITLCLEEPRFSGVLELAVFFATVSRGPAEVLGGSELCTPRRVLNEIDTRLEGRLGVTLDALRLRAIMNGIQSCLPRGILF